MTRKLLPYEYELIETLGVSKEEYLDFVAQQHIYKDAKEGTQLDIRNWEVVAIVLRLLAFYSKLPRFCLPLSLGRRNNNNNNKPAPSKHAIKRYHHALALTATRS
jgi:hypothetical protein